MGARLQPLQHVEQAVAVLAARQAHHHAVALLDHVEVDDGLAHLAAQAFFELERLALGARAGGGAGGRAVLDGHGDGPRAGNSMSVKVMARIVPQSPCAGFAA
jgi:hypothetical protein